MIQMQKHCWIATNVAMQPAREIGFLWPKICCENGLLHVTVASSPKPDMRLEKAAGCSDYLLSPSSSTGEQKQQAFAPNFLLRYLP